jgi:hypothetical protein
MRTVARRAEETPMSQECVHCSRLVDSIDEAYQRARADFDAPESPSMDGVVWLSAHLAALDYAIHPSLRGSVPCAAPTLRAQRRLASQLQRVVRGVEQRRSGDGLAPRLPWATSRERLLSMLDVHAAAEREMVHELAAAIGAEQTEQLLHRYLHALHRGPTRPHLYGPRRGIARRLRFRLDAARDHVLDTLDNRSTPFPHVPAPRRPVGRWGRYVLGSANFDSAVPRS